MTKPVKITVGILAACIVLVVVAALLAVVFFPGEKIREMAEKKASEAVGLDVSIGHVGLSFAGIPSVKVDDITVGSPRDGEQPLLSLESARVRVRLLKLLKREVEIVLIELVSPQVVVINRADSTSNLPESKEEPLSAETEQEDAVSPPSLPFPVTLETFRVRDASALLDNSATTGSTIAATDIDMTMNFDISSDMKALSSAGKTTIGDISLGDTRKQTTLDGIGISFEHELTGDIPAGELTLTKGDLRVNGLPVAVSGGVKGWTMAAFNVAMKDMDIEKVLKAAPEGIIPERDKLTAEGTFSLTIDGTADMSGPEPVIAYSGGIEFTIGHLAFQGLPKSVDGANGRIAFTEKRIDIRSLDARIAQSAFELSGIIDNYTEDPAVSLKSKGNIDLADVSGAVPMSEGVSVSGHLDFDVAMNGKPSDPSGFKAEGGANLEKVTAVLPKVFKNPVALNGSMVFTPASVNVEKIRMDSGKSDLVFDGRITNYMALAGLGEETARFTGTVASNMLVLDDLFVIDESSTAKPWDFEEPLKNAPIPPNLSSELLVNFNTVSYAKLKADKVQGRLTFVDRVMELNDLAVAAYGGSLTGSSVFNIANPDNATYGGDFKLNAFDSAMFIADFLGAGDIFRGKLSSGLSFSGAGLDSLSMLSNLKMHGDMMFEDGQIVNWGFAQKLGEALPFINFDTIDFQSIKNSFKVEDQKFITPDMAITTSFGDLQVNGFTGFDKKVDYDITFTLDRATSEKALGSLGNLSNYLQVKPERLSLAVIAGGSLTSPTFSVDTSAAETYLKDALRDRVTSEAEKFLDSKGADDLKEKGKTLLRDLLKKD